MSLIYLPMQINSIYPRTSGFGLIELMVSVSIMVLVSGIVLTRHSAFNGATLLRGQAYEVALLLREVQSTAISAAFADAVGYRNVLGVYFNSNAGANGLYAVFRDDDADYFYSTSEVFGEQGILDPRFEISAIRLIGGGGGTVDELSVLFERPNFDAKLYEGPGNPVASGVSGVEIDVRLRGTSGATSAEVRTVEVTKTGQISVKNI
jgi:type II secretory pathway pseudopilin PulG